MLIMSSETRINVRTTPEIKRDLEVAARLKGMTVSALINSLAVKVIREEKEYDPSAFAMAKGVRSGTVRVESPDRLRETG